MPIPTPASWSNEVERHQNPWTVMNEYSKTVITLASSILAVTATFSTNLLGGHPSWGAWTCLLVSWALLIIAIIAALLVTASLTNYLRGTTTNPWPASRASNISFFALTLALVSFAVLGLVRLWPTKPKPDIAAAINTMAAFKTYPGVPTDPRPSAVLESIQWEAGANEWTGQIELTYCSNGTRRLQKFVASVDPSGTRVLALRKVD